jgi:hypothetical protein
VEEALNRVINFDDVHAPLQASGSRPTTYVNPSPGNNPHDPGLAMSIRGGLAVKANAIGQALLDLTVLPVAIKLME